MDLDSGYFPVARICSTIMFAYLSLVITLLMNTVAFLSLFAVDSIMLLTSFSCCCSILTLLVKVIKDIGSYRNCVLYFNVCVWELFFNFGGHESFCGATDISVLDFWWRLHWGSKPEWAALFALGVGICVICSLEIHLLCDTCRPLDIQHGCRADLFK